jgi:type VI secretion system secreted protein Hcp
VAFDAFLKLVPASAGQPVPTGESQDQVHRGEIPLLGYNITTTRPVTQGSAGAGAGKATFADFTFSTPVSRASPLFFQACAAGTHYQQAIVTLRKAGGKAGGGLEFLKITMGTVVVSSYSSGGSGGDDIPHDEVHLSYGKVQFQYTPQRPDGSADAPVNGGWDIQKNGPA